MNVLQTVPWTLKAQVWWTVTVFVAMCLVVNVTSLSGPNVCMVKQKYNITKRVKYRAPMSVRTYEWCFAMPPRCSRWNTEMRDVTRLETEERTAEMAACCPGFKLKDVSCVPVCPSGKTGHGCSEDCPSNKWGPSCMHECKKCDHGSCDALTGACRCQDGWQGESCETSMTTTPEAAMMERLLTTELTTSTKITTQTRPIVTTTSRTPTLLSTNNRISSHTNKGTSTSIVTDTTGGNTSTTPSTTITTSPHILMPAIGTDTTVSMTPAGSKDTIVTTKEEEPTTHLTSTPPSSVTFSNSSLSTIAISTLNTYNVLTQDENKVTKVSVLNSSYNRTEVPGERVKTVSPVKDFSSSQTTTVKLDFESTTISTTKAPSTKASTALVTTTTAKPEMKKTETTVKQTSTSKFKPKEIWIKPAQKGESPIFDTKLKSNQDQSHLKLKYKDLNEVTTPKTIIVSIIPTSVAYVTFKKISLTTISSMVQKNHFPAAVSPNSTTEPEFTKPMEVPTTSTPLSVKTDHSNTKKINTLSLSTTNPPLLRQHVTKTYSHTATTKGKLKTTMPTTQTTNSMLSTLNVANKRLNSSSLSTVSSLPTNVTKPTREPYSSSETSTSKTFVTQSDKIQIQSVTVKTTTEHNISVPKKLFTALQTNSKSNQITSRVTESSEVTKAVVEKQADSNSKSNLTNSNTTTNFVTDAPSKDEETFHILTEPEHITAVMGDKSDERTTINLISVISIAGGIMMAMITIAVIIVMLERCRKPRYDDVRKYNDISMQVMIDNNDVPPPYVRSIFHTPLPDPPTSEKCHYQPISTLDRNLKQFMRPVVVQTISPLMLENFRGILECHYDHLPRRSQDMGTMQTRCSVAPSIEEREELLPPPRVHSLTDSDIEAMKCEAKLDMIDNTTSEPLYAEIPCWRPPSAHAIEVVNMNGEAVTEL